MRGTTGRGLTGTLFFLAGARLVINTAHRFVYPFLPAISRGLGVSLDTAGLLVSARWVSGLATPAIVAALGRGERRRRLIAFGLALFSLGAAITAITSVFVGALAGFLMMGLAKPVYDISAQSYVADRVPYSTRARYLALLELTWASSLLIGAPAAGLLIERVGWRAPFWAIALLLGLALWLQSVILEPDTPTQPHHRSRLSWDRSAVGLLVVITLFSAASEIVFIAFGAWLENEFSFSLVALGGTAVLVALVELTAEGSTVAFTDRIGKRRAVGVGIVIAAVGFASLALVNDKYALGMVGLLIGVGGFEFTVVSSVPLSTEVRPHGRARYLSWVIVATSLGRGAGAAAGPPLFSAGGMGANAVVAAVANLLALVVLIAWVRESHPPTGLDAARAVDERGR